MKANSLSKRMWNMANGALVRETKPTLYLNLNQESTKNKSFILGSITLSLLSI